MNFFNVFLAVLSAAAGFYALHILDAPRSYVMAVVFGLLAGYAFALTAGGRKRKVIVRLRGLSWTREDFCRGWLILYPPFPMSTEGLRRVAYSAEQSDSRIEWQHRAEQAREANDE